MKPCAGCKPRRQICRPLKYYIPTRYPNGLPDLTPGESYFKNDADQAIETAVSFLKFAEEYLKSDL